jgi:hypothetical protein
MAYLSQAILRQIYGLAGRSPMRGRCCRLEGVTRARSWLVCRVDDKGDFHADPHLAVGRDPVKPTKNLRALGEFDYNEPVRNLGLQLRSRSHFDARVSPDSARSGYWPPVILYRMAPRAYFHGGEPAVTALVAHLEQELELLQAVPERLGNKAWARTQSLSLRQAPSGIAPGQMCAARLSSQGKGH